MKQDNLNQPDDECDDLPTEMRDPVEATQATLRAATPGNPPAPCAWLEWISGEPEPKEKRWAIGNKEMIGRKEKFASIVLEHEEVSARHASIELGADGAWWLGDDVSTNGTKVNKAPVQRGVPMKLQHGDRITIFPYHLVFKTAEGTQPTEGAEADELTAPADSDVTVRCETRHQSCWLVAMEIMDFAGFQKRHTPDTQTRLLGSWFCWIEEAIGRYGGEISRFTGSGIVAHWIGQSSAQDERVAYCLDELRATCRRKPPAFRLAVHFGEATPKPGEAETETVIEGPAVDMALQYAQAAEKLKAGCLFSETAEQRLARYCDLKFLGDYRLSEQRNASPVYVPSEEIR